VTSSVGKIASSTLGFHYIGAARHAYGTCRVATHLRQEVREECERRRRQQRDSVLTADCLRLTCYAQPAVLSSSMLFWRAQAFSMSTAHSAISHQHGKVRTCAEEDVARHERRQVQDGRHDGGDLGAGAGRGDRQAECQLRGREQQQRRDEEAAPETLHASYCGSVILLAEGCRR